MDLSDKRALVTGAASGIGRATAVRFGERGAREVACLDIHDEGNAATAVLVERSGARALPVHLDLGRVPDIERAYGEVVAAFGRLDAAAHIGGYSWRGETLDVTEAEWDMVINANLRATFFCCQQALRTMYEQGSGAIVNMSADAAWFPIQGMAVQAAGKGGIVPMTCTMALESARRGVRVNAVSPGITQVQPSGAPRPPGPELRRDAGLPMDMPGTDLSDQTAAGRWMHPNEIADVVIFLCSDAASGVNGTVTHVNGGGYLSLAY